MDVTLNDLLILDPRLTSRAPRSDGGSGDVNHDQTVVSWAVTLRATPPHLPALNGGELIVVPQRVVLGLGNALPGLIREVQGLGASAVILPRSFDGGEEAALAGILPLLTWNDAVNHDTETVINRELTEWRGNLYRIGSELERRMTEVAMNSAGIKALVQGVAEVSGLPVRILDPRGRLLVSMPELDASDPRDAQLLERPSVTVDLASGATLVLGPLRAAQRIVARFLAPRIAAATELALRHEDAAKPRGMRRVQATDSLLANLSLSASDRRATALALGIDPDALFLVAVSHGAEEAEVTRALQPLGALHPAASDNGRRLVLVATDERAAQGNRSTRIDDTKRRWEKDHRGNGATLALSAPALGVASLPRATREARFVSSLLVQDQFPRRAASFDSVEDIGALRLLYELRDSNELRQFVNQALGGLEKRDQRGTLRETLRAFLESGGSQVDASNKLGIHRNTLAYRLRRIDEIVGRDVGDPASWLTLHLALSAAEMLDVVQGE